MPAMSQDDQPVPDIPVEPIKTTASKKIRKPTSEEFVTSWPLYVATELENFDAPDSVSYFCDFVTCEKETTWLRVEDTQFQPLYSDAYNISDGFRWVWYTCAYCHTAWFLVMYRKDMFGLEKIGQTPAISVEVPTALRNSLGAEGLNLYRKALTCRNNGYGLAALAYIRRVVEDRTNELIEVVAKLAESHGADHETIAHIRAATGKETYDQKLQLAATVFPESLNINGINPLKELHGLVSEGVHGMTEEECLAVADETQNVFEFIFTQLRTQTTARKDFVEKVKKWAGRKQTKISNKAPGSL